MKKIIVYFLLLIVFGTLSALDEFTQSIADELKKPGVKLVAVDFYTTGCPPCDAAIPKWKELQRKYGDKGFKLIVVSVLSEGKCSSPKQQWNSDKKVCDYDGKIAATWHVAGFPEAFLWSWDGNLLVSHGTVDNVASAIEDYFNKEPRILIEEGSDKNIYQLVRSELNKRSKFEILSSREEQEELAKVRERSSQAVYNDELRCKGGVQVSANSLLKISKVQKNLVLDLHSAEKGCLMSSGSAEMRGNIETAVKEAVSDLLKNLLGDFKMPEKGKNDAREGSFGGLSPNDVWMPEYKEEVVIEFLSEPAGAAVIADGKMICPSTPCSRTLTLEKHEIEMQKEKYIPKKGGQQISKGKPVKYKLDPDFALLSVTGKKNVELFIDGKSAGKLPIKELEIKLGPHKIEQKDQCFHYSGEVFTVKSGEKKEINLRLDDKQSAVNIHAQNEKGDAMEADVYVDDKKVGRAPGTFKVSLCSKKLVVKSGDFECSEKLSLKEKQVETLQVTLKNKISKSSVVKIENLQWSNKASRIMNWYDAVNYCDNLIENGYYDWRLPNIDELRTLIQNHYSTQAGGSCPISEKAGKLAWIDRTSDCDGIYGSNFSKLGDTEWFWSSSNESDDSNYAWLVAFDFGYYGYVGIGKDEDRFNVRCVR